jgi:hypothetical protein
LEPIERKGWVLLITREERPNEVLGCRGENDDFIIPFQLMAAK